MFQVDATHMQWKDTLVFNEGGPRSFKRRRDPSKKNTGVYEYDGTVLKLIWKHWAPESLNKTDSGDFVSKETNFKIHFGSKTSKLTITKSSPSGMVLPTTSVKSEPSEMPETKSSPSGMVLQTTSKSEPSEMPETKSSPSRMVLPTSSVKLEPLKIPDTYINDDIASRMDTLREIKSIDERLQQWDSLVQGSNLQRPLPATEDGDKADTAEADMTDTEEADKTVTEKDDMMIELSDKDDADDKATKKPQNKSRKKNKKKLEINI